MNVYIEAIKKILFEISPKIITALLILFVGLWVTSLITRTFKKIMRSRNIEPTLSNFLGNLIFWALRVIVFIAVVSKLGVETSSFVAILGAAGLAIGLSLQGSLSNFAGGILIILFKPFKVGDLIDAQGDIGTVEEIQIFSTKITTDHGHVVYIPNGILSNGKIKNFSQLPTQKTDFDFTTSHDRNLNEFKNKLHTVINNHGLVLKDPKPEINLSSFTDTSVTFTIQIWTRNSDASTAKSEILEEIRSYIRN